MKTLSPAQPLDSHVFTFTLSQNPMDTKTVQAGSFSLCEVCNLQLGSAAQAQVHMNGKSHQRRVRQLHNGENLQTSASQITRITPPTSLSPSHLSTTTTASESGSVGGSLPGLVSSSVMMKPFLTFPVETSSPVGLFPNFNSMDPVQKAVINHTFGVSMVTRKKQSISCNVCQLRFNSSSQAEAHYRGSRHAKKLKSQENKAKAKVSSENKESSPPTGPTPLKSTSTLHTDVCAVDSPPLKTSTEKTESHLEKTGSDPPPSPPSAVLTSDPPSVTPTPTQVLSHDAPLTSLESEEEKAKKLLYCSLCKVAVNSLSQLEAHNAGSKHKTMLEARSGAGPIKSYPRLGAKLKTSGPLKGSGLQNKTFHCQICDVHVNSEIQLKQHISSRRHKDRVAGKPSKPKFSPYNTKGQHGTLTKDSVKPPLSPLFPSLPFVPPSSLPSALSLPPSSLSSVLSMSPSSLSSPLPSPLTVSASSLLTASFLRPAPGPIRTSHGSILFAPY